jgi:D-alanyl-D-alanine carboxypeptidase (penicillin-binding protein 5/6)
MLRRLFTLSLTFALVLAAAPYANAATKKKKAPADADSSDKAEPFPAYTDSGLPAVHAASVVVVDAQSGKTLYEKGADEPRPVASTQKLLTSLIVAEHGDLDAQVPVEEPDTWAEPTMLHIKPGETYRRGDLLRVLLVKSENDVARCLARDNAGSVEAFASKMNAKAAQLGMTNSYFINPNGLPIAGGQHSTARDMAKLALAAYHNRTIRSLVCLKETQWRYPSGKVTTFKNTNRVLRNYALCNGMKTGYTEAAGHCLVSSAANGSREVICVVLGDNRDVWIDSYRLLNWGLAGGSVAANGSASPR